MPLAREIEATSPRIWGRLLVEPLIGRSSGSTRVLVSHDVSGALEESDVALGLRGGRPAPVDAELYR